MDEWAYGFMYNLSHCTWTVTGLTPLVCLPFFWFPSRSLSRYWTQPVWLDVWTWNFSGGGIVMSVWTHDWTRTDAVVRRQVASLLSTENRKLSSRRGMSKISHRKMHWPLEQTPTIFIFWFSEKKLYKIKKQFGSHGDISGVWHPLGQLLLKT